MLPIEGPDRPWREWGYVAAMRGEATLYAWTAAPSDFSLRTTDGFDSRGDYPPLALYELGMAARLYHRATGGFSRGDALTATAKAPAVLAEAAFAVFLFLLALRIRGVKVARRVTMVFWLNPAMLLATSTLGYVDALAVLPAAGALVAGTAGWPALSGALIAAAVLTKPQIVLVLPAVVVAIWNCGSVNRVQSACSALMGAAVASAIILLPIILSGATRNMVLALGTLTLGKDMLSNAANLWWIVGHLLRVSAESGGDLWAAVTTPADIVAISSFASFDSIATRISVRAFGAILALGAIAWGMWTIRRARDLWLMSAAGAFFVHAYAVLATQVHENHLFAAVPLLAIATIGRSRFLPLYAVLTVIFALNLNLLFGINAQDNSYAIPRMATGIDATLLLALLNCAALVWHAVVLRRECMDVAVTTRVSFPQAGERPSAPAPVGLSS